jgi:Protein of unknown function (DUF2380)/Secretory lipase
MSVWPANATSASPFRLTKKEGQVVPALPLLRLRDFGSHYRGPSKIVAMIITDLMRGGIFAVLGTFGAFAASPPGSLISVTAMSGAPEGASAYRILYTSTGLSGEPVPVSGVIIVPAGAIPPGGRPIVAWAHPTTGIVSRCAPSLARVFFASVQGLGAMLERGYIVAATDYPGLGTPEVHPYLVGISEGRAVLDSVRAALPNCNGCERDLAEKTGAEWAAWGTVQKVSNLILNINLYMEDVQTGRIEFAHSVDIRGNTDESWRHGLNYMIRNCVLEQP